MVGDVSWIGKGDVSFFRFYIEEENFGASLTISLPENDGNKDQKQIFHSVKLAIKLKSQLIP